jgi:beta-lactamase regulating signal transducer with metallopeptidase domain/Ca2+-binding EF-hand superfamily protein
MNSLLPNSASWHEVIAIVLLHFVWQAFAVAVLVELAVRGLRIKHGTSRYAAYLIAFLVLAACPLLTLGYLLSTSTNSIAATSMLQTVGTQTEAWSLGLASLVRPYSMWITTLWIAGVAVLGLRFASGVWMLHKIRAGLQPVSRQIVQRATQIAHRLGVKTSWEVRASATIREPMTFGWLRPIVVVPVSLLTAQPPEIVDAMLAHELAHIRRHDLWVNAFQCLIESVLFFHPVVWWLSRRVRQQRELCCDDMAVRLTGEPIAYATALERVASIRLAGNVAPLAVAMGATVLSYRVRRVLGLADSVTAEIAPSPRLLVAGAALCGALLLMSTGGAEWIGQQVASPTPVKNPSIQLSAVESSNDETSDDTKQQQVEKEYFLASTSENEPPKAVTKSPKTLVVESIEVVQNESKKRSSPKTCAKNPALKRFDLNGDGVLDAAERKAIKTAYSNKMKQRSQQWLAKYDTNKDGQLDLREKAAAWGKHRGSKHWRHSDSKHARHSNYKQHSGDRQHSGGMHLGHHKPGDRSSHGSRHEAWRKQLLAKYDKDKSGSLEATEREAMAVAWKERRKQQWQAFIDRYDIDGDGRIDEHERMAIRLARVRASQVERKYPGST